jgi:hypothetical protein
VKLATLQQVFEFPPETGDGGRIDDRGWKCSDEVCMSVLHQSKRQRIWCLYASFLSSD